MGNDPYRDSKRGGALGSHPHPDPDVMFNRMAEQGVLVHLRTNRIYELNRTATRLWELLSSGHERHRIVEILIKEFDVSESLLEDEVEQMLAAFEREQLISARKS